MALFGGEGAVGEGVSEMPAPPLDASLRRLVLIPVLWVAVLVAGVFLVPRPDLPLFYRLELAASEVAGLAGCFIAASAFERSDYLYRAWAYNAVCFLFIFVSDGSRFPVFDGILGGGAPADLFRGSISLIGNVFAVIGAWLFGRAWSEAELPGAERTRKRAYVAAAVVAFGFAGEPLVNDVMAVWFGDRAALVNVASEIGDIGSLCAMAPVLPVAFALRGGRLAWPWSLLGASMLAWLAFDGAVAVAHDAYATNDARLYIEIFRSLGCLFTLSAGIAQARVIRLMRREPSIPDGAR